MRQLTSRRRPPGLARRPEPDLQDDAQALGASARRGTCDLDLPIVTGVAPFPTPIAMGHECVAEVVAVGRAVRSVRVGRPGRRAVPGRVRHLRRCDRDLTGDCERMPPLSMYGFGAAGGDHGGFLSDLVRVPFADAMLVAVPADLDPAALASASDNIPTPGASSRPTSRRCRRRRADRRRRHPVDRPVRRRPRPGAGRGRIDYVDADEGRRAVASDLGARVLDPDTPLDRRYPITADCSASEAGLKQALRATEPGGHCTHAGVIWGEDDAERARALHPRRDGCTSAGPPARPAIPAILARRRPAGCDQAGSPDRVLPFAEGRPGRVLEPHTEARLRARLRRSGHRLAGRRGGRAQVARRGACASLGHDVGASSSVRTRRSSGKSAARRGARRATRPARRAWSGPWCRAPPTASGTGVVAAPRPPDLGS
jgi:threonine dehydrogenase-like Zn-dependent dehydrogenase